MALTRSAKINDITGLCITKLDVLDGLETVRICTGYEVAGRTSSVAPLGAEAFGECRPVYEEVPGWRESTVGLHRYDELPQNARHYLRRIEEISDIPVDIISTGPDRAETIILRHPFEH